MITLLFIFRLKSKLKKLQYYGLSNISLNPNFRSSSQISSNLIPKHMEIHNQQKNRKSKYLFYPNSIFILIWNVFNLIFISYFLTLLPVFIIFNINYTFFFVLEIIIDVYFIIDLILNFNISFKLKDGTYEQSRTKIIIKYLKSYFIIDFITSFPIGIILSTHIDGNNSYNKILRIFKLPKLVATLKMTKIFTLNKFLKSMKIRDFWKFKVKVHQNFFKTLYITSITYFVLHLAACIFIAIGKLDIYFPNTWLVRENLLHQSNMDIYLNSFYYCFVVLTTVGYGDIVSQNTVERTFTLIWMLFGIAFYSYTISFITRFFTSKENRNSLLAKKIKNIERFAEENKIDKKLLDQLIKSIEYSSEKICYRWLQGDMNIIKNMNQELKFEFLKEFHKELLKSPFFDTQDSSFVVRIVSLLKPLQLLKGQYLWKKDDNANYICFITKGKAYLMVENIFYQKHKPKKEKYSKIQNSLFWKDLKNILTMNGTKKQSVNQPLKIKRVNQLLSCDQLAIKIYGFGTYFGEDEIINKKRRTYGVKAATNLEMMLLSKEDFEKVLKVEFPHIFDKIIRLSQSRKLDIQQTTQYMFKDIKNFCIKNDIPFGENLFHPLLKKKLSQLKKFKENNFNSLEEFYISSEEVNPMKGIIKDLKIQEVYQNVQYIEQQSDAIEFQKINTPGLGKMFSDWKGILISAEIYLQKQQKDEKSIKKYLIKKDSQKKTKFKSQLKDQTFQLNFQLFTEILNWI